MRHWCLNFVLTSAFALAACAQPAPAPPAVTPPATEKGPQLSDPEMEVFLKTARIVSRKESDSGTTLPTRATLSDGTLTHDAQIQCIDDYKPLWKGEDGTEEKNFRDSWKYNVAAYRLSKLLDLDMVPMSVERNIDGKQCAVTWWLDNIWLVEAERRQKGIKPPASDFWVNQLNSIRVFDQLIQNVDRNQGNLLITPEWRVWMIDHTRAFRLKKTLMTHREPLMRIDVKLLDALKALTQESVREAVGPWLRPEEMNAILARRDAIVSYFEREVREKGEEAVLTGIPRSTPRVTIP